MDGIVSDPDAFRTSLEIIRTATTNYIRSSPRYKKSKREAQPFIVITKNMTITIP